MERLKTGSLPNPDRWLCLLVNLRIMLECIFQLTDILLCCHDGRLLCDRRLDHTSGQSRLFKQMPVGFCLIPEFARIQNAFPVHRDDAALSLPGFNDAAVAEHFQSLPDCNTADSHQLHKLLLTWNQISLFVFSAPHRILNAVKHLFIQWIT